MSVKVFDWVESNIPLISEIYMPLAKTELALMDSYDDVFKDAIRENTKTLLYSLVCVEFNRCTGESAEEFYGLVDPDSLYNFIVRLEDFYEEDM